jgi:GT2 family glycosyltransferase
MQATGNSNFNFKNSSSSVAICIATYRRPELLRDLLSALAQLTFTKTSTPAIEVIVVDNDSSRSAKPACQLPDFPWTIRYICEPNRGIARARNSAIAAARSPAFLAFIDDDEVPHANWLDELLWTQSQFQADVVSGPVLPAYTADVPQWIRNGGFFRRPVFRTGDVVKLSSTNNALVRSSVLATVPGFDEQFNLTGAEDSHFFLRIRESGFKMIFSSAAVVYEPITEQRANLSWLLRRGYQAGNSWALCEGHVKPQDSAARGFKGIAHMFRGIVRLPGSLWRGKAAVVRNLQELCSGAGMLTGVVGHRFEPYHHKGSNTTHTPLDSKLQS